jgi:hypothetical protein
MTTKIARRLGEQLQINDKEHKRKTRWQCSTTTKTRQKKHMKTSEKKQETLWAYKGSYCFI